MPDGDSEDFGLDRLEAQETGSPDSTTKGPFDGGFRPPHVGGSWGDPTDPETYLPGAKTHRDHKRDLSQNGYYSFVGFYFVLYQTAGAVDEPKKRLIFPVNPDTFQVAQARGFGTYDLVAGKQGMQIGQLQLRQITLSSFLPAVYDEDYCVGHYLDYCGDKGENPMVAVYWLQDRMKEKKNLYFAGLPISQGDQEPGQQVLQEMPCHITNFSYAYQSGNPRDVFFDIELTEYRDLKVTKTTGKPPSGPKEPTAKKYTTKIGDSFIDVAKAQYGQNYGNLATKIKAANPGADYAKGAKPGLGASLAKGTVLKIPDPGK